MQDSANVIVFGIIGFMVNPQALAISTVFHLTAIPYAVDTFYLFSVHTAHYTFFHEQKTTHITYNFQQHFVFECEQIYRAKYVTCYEFEIMIILK